jgi:hypothetical protein
VPRRRPVRQRHSRGHRTPRQPGDDAPDRADRGRARTAARPDGAVTTFAVSFNLMAAGLKPAMLEPLAPATGAAAGSLAELADGTRRPRSVSSRLAMPSGLPNSFAWLRRSTELSGEPGQDGFMSCRTCTGAFSPIINRLPRGATRARSHPAEVYSPPGLMYGAMPPSCRCRTGWLDPVRQDPAKGRRRFL